MVVAVAVVLAAAVWKPWEVGRPTGRTAAVQVPAGAEVGLLPAITSDPRETDAPAPTPRQTPITFAGLDLEIMGTADPHPAWGVAVAYVSRTQFDNAARRRSPTVTPVVSWELIEPGRHAPGPTLDHPAVTSVAIAPTWPLGIRPRSIQVFFTPFGLGPTTGTSADPAARQAIPLGRSLSSRLRDGAGQPPGSVFTSGDFFLPSSTPLGDPAGWIGSGWPSGAYVLEVDLEGGVRSTLPFTIGVPPGP